MSGYDIARHIVGDAPSIERLRRTIQQIAPTRLPVLIEGPTGAGKELVAQALHRASGRSGAFVPFNVCAITDTLFEDALFGHARGAFTGAVAESAGYLAEANGGTVFLDEVGGLSLGAQAKLLRAIETQEFRPLGARRDRQSDFRCVAAANEPLQRLVASGRFRADLFHRLAAVTLEVPPLRERFEDIPLLVTHLVHATRGAAAIVPFDNDALAVLKSYTWPGNVRQLRHVVEVALALSPRGMIRASDVRPLLRQGEAMAGECGPAAVPPGAAPERTPVEEEARARVVAALEQCQWDVARAANALSVHRATFYRWMRRFGVVVPPGVLLGRAMRAPEASAVAPR
jgi:DNA-binding NtrC family response regulator